MKITLKEMIEAFKPFKARNRDYWSLNWRRDSPESGGTTAIMFENTTLNQTIRLEEKKDGSYLVEIREGSDLMTSDIFEEFEKAKQYAIQYMENAKVPPESINSKGMFERLFTTAILEQANQRALDKENHLFKEQTQEYLRNLNLIIDNNNLEKDVIDKSKKIRDFILKIIK
jgi:hypothetical protein